MAHTHATSTARAAILLFTLGFATACGTITPGPSRAIPALERPVLGDVTLVGLVFENWRAAGETTRVTTGTGNATATTSGYGTNALTTTGTANATQVSTTTQMERYDDDSIQVALRYALEDRHVVRRFVPNSRLRIEGRRTSGGAATGAGTIAWDFVNAVTMLSFVPGLPFFGSQEADIELRVYYDDALLRSYHGHGTASWSKNGWGILRVIGDLRQSALNAASAVAARDAVVALIDDPPHVPPAEDAVVGRSETDRRPAMPREAAR
jgi:hypothetical protein